MALNTLRALAGAGHDIVFVSPSEGTPAAVEAIREAMREWSEPILTVPRARPALDAAARALFGVAPFTIRRHYRAKVKAAVAGRLAAGRFDVVHCEQVHALAQAAPAEALGVPMVLRQHNVESDLWRQLARELPWKLRLLSPLVHIEAVRMRQYERRAMRRVDATVALTARDEERLAALAGPGPLVRAVRAPFPAQLPAAENGLAGEPAAVLFGDQRWLPNRLQCERFIGEAWPRVARDLPEARLHAFGSVRGASRNDGVVRHPAPLDSRDAFAPGGVLVVPLRVASGVRMKILEAWARGVPVVATSLAAAGLEVEDGRELLLAEDGEGFARALGRLATEPELAAGLTARGRQALAARHDPATIAAELIAVYREAIARHSAGAA